jgi:hypothetical protein
MFINTSELNGTKKGKGFVKRKGRKSSLILKLEAPVCHSVVNAGEVHC